MSITPRYQLFYSVRSPFARRVRIAMQRLNLPFEAKEISVFEPTVEFLSANPLGTVPVLTAQLGQQKFSVPDSATILEYLHDVHGARIWPSEMATRTQVRAASTLAEGIMANVVSLFLERQRKQPSLEWELEFEENITRALMKIAETPVTQMPWKVSDLQLTQAGYDLIVALEYLELRAPQYGLIEKFPTLAQFLQVHRQRADLAPSTPPA